MFSGRVQGQFLSLRLPSIKDKLARTPRHVLARVAGLKSGDRELSAHTLPAMAKLFPLVLLGCLPQGLEFLMFNLLERLWLQSVS